MADFSIQLSADNIEFIPTSEKAWKWLRKSGKVGDLQGPNKGLLRDAVSAQVLAEALFRAGLTWADTNIASGRSPLIPTPAEVEARQKIADAAQSTPEMSGLGKWANSSGGCLTILAMPVVFIAILLLAFCSHNDGDEKAETNSETPEEARDRQEKNQADEAGLAAQHNLKMSLMDGDSARFDGMFISRLEGGNLMLCGRVNAKNALGAYTGFSRFIASPNPAAPSVVDGQSSGLSRSQFEQAYYAACSNFVERFE